MNGVGVPPEKLSDLIELAVADARTLDRDTYIPDCWAWHAPDGTTSAGSAWPEP